LDASTEFELTLAEQLQIINLCPTTLVEVYLSVDDIESRIGAEKASELLEVVQRTLYLEEDEENAKVEVTPLLKERVSKQGPRNGSKQGGPKGKGGRGRGRGGPRSGSSERPPNKR
jgi:hypothetical protein